MKTRNYRQEAEFAVLTTLSLYRGTPLSTEDVGQISGVKRPRRALRRLERLGLAKSISGRYKGRQQALRGWQLVGGTPS
jgi:hypothetical protein